MNERLINMFTSLGKDDFIIRRAIPADTRHLQEICDAWIEKGFFEGDTLPSDYIEGCFKNGDLPPVAHARMEDYALYVVEIDRKIIGLFDIYDGYPKSHTAWISLFLLEIESRGLGLGKKIHIAIEKECRRLGFESLGMSVSMNNRIALKFWVNLGYKEILGIYGDLKYPVIALKMKL